MARPEPQPQRPSAAPLRGGLALLLAAVSVAPQAGLAQVAAGGLGTRVNGTALGRCAAGVCQVQGGTSAGATLFHRFSQFDTRSGIQRVNLDSRGRTNVVVGVSHPSGSFFGAPLQLSGAANLFWLSPGGIWLGNGARFQGATSLLLSTAPTLRIGGGEFSAVGGLSDGLGIVGEGAKLDIEALARDGLTGDTLASGSGAIVLAGGRLTVDRHLLLHSGAGAIRSAPEAGRTTLQAGRSLQLSGGEIALRGMDLEAGSGGVEDLVRIQSGRLAGGGVGSLALTDASLRGSRLLLEGAGGVELRQVEARAGGLAGPGEVGIYAGTRETAAAARLSGVHLEGGEVAIGARGPLEAQRLRVVAGGGNGNGRVRLVAGPSANETTSLRLEDASLQGRTVVISSQGPGRLANVQASAGRAGGIWMNTSSGAGQSPSPLVLQGVKLGGDTVQVSARGDLEANDLTIGGRLVSLEAAAPADGTASVRLERTRLTGYPDTRAPGQQAERVQVLSGGALQADGLQASGGTVLLEADGPMRLTAGELKAIGTKGQIQMDALSPKGAPKQGQLELQGSNIEAQTITARADRSVTLQQTTLTAGQPGKRGIVRVETNPPPQPAKRRTLPAPRTGDVKIEASQLEGQWLLVRSGAIELSGSVLEAPKGIIQLDADGGDINLNSSRLDVGVRHPLDLRREVSTTTKIGKTVSINQAEPQAAISLFAAGNIRIGDGSALHASQDVTAILKAHPDFDENNIRLLDNSGLIVVDALKSLQITNSRLDADATVNLAGDILLRSRSSDGQGGISVRNVSISASGGAGSGDLRITSAGGIQIENSTLLALSSLRFEDPGHPGQPSAYQGFAGGEITLTNSSNEKGIAIRDSQLNAEQSLTDEVLSANKRNGSETIGVTFFDKNDNTDNNKIYTGGIISILSDSGIHISGANAIINVGEASGESKHTENIGGILRLGNASASHSIDIEAGARLSASSRPSGARGTINLWSNGPINLRDATVDASIYPQASFRSQASQAAPIDANLSLLSASSITTTNSILRSIDPAKESAPRLSCAVGCEPNEWSPARHREFLDVLFWGKDRTSSGLEFSNNSPVKDTTSIGISDQQKTPFSDLPDDWLIVADLPPQPIRNSPAPILPTNLKPNFNGLLSTTLAATTNLIIPWPDSTRWDGQAMRQSAVILATPPELASLSDASLTASNPRPLSRADAEQVFAEDQDKALRTALPLLAPGRKIRNAWNTLSLQENLRRAMAQSLQLAPKMAYGKDYRPAVLQISLTQRAGTKQAQINHILLASSGDLQGWQSQVDAEKLQRAVRRFQQQLSSLADLGDGRAGQELASVLIGPVIAEIRRLGVNALLLSLDRGLQGIPFAALPIGEETLADVAALTVTPALALTDLMAPPSPARSRVVLAGSSRFSNGLAPLPMARQELEQLATLLPTPLLLLDKDFSPQSLLKATQQESVRILHIASHADFATSSRSPEAKIYTNDGEISMANLAKSLSTLNGEIELFFLNACRTAAGDEQRELGITGLALQTGAHSALGNLWYVDDVASTALSLQFYRNLQQGLRRDQALQETQRQFRQGEIRVKGDAIINANQEVLVSQLNKSQQRQLDGTLSHAYYWAGILLSGSPW